MRIVLRPRREGGETRADCSHATNPIWYRLWARLMRLLHRSSALTTPPLGSTTIKQPDHTSRWKPATALSRNLRQYVFTEQLNLLTFYLFRRCQFVQKICHLKISESKYCTYICNITFCTRNNCKYDELSIHNNSLNLRMIHVLYRWQSGLDL